MRTAEPGPPEERSTFVITVNGREREITGPWGEVLGGAIMAFAMLFMAFAMTAMAFLVPVVMLGAIAAMVFGLYLLVAALAVGLPIGLAIVIAVILGMAVTVGVLWIGDKALVALGRNGFQVDVPTASGQQPGWYTRLKVTRNSFRKRDASPTS